MRATPAETDARMHANGSTKPDAGDGGESLVSTREDHTHVERSEAELPAGSDRGAQPHPPRPTDFTPPRDGAPQG